MDISKLGGNGKKLLTSEEVQAGLFSYRARFCQNTKKGNAEMLKGQICRCSHDKSQSSRIQAHALVPGYVFVLRVWRQTGNLLAENISFIGTYVLPFPIVIALLLLSFSIKHAFPCQED